jgi:DNA-binding SARP family transcriptional activator
MRFQVLGPLEVRSELGDVTPSAPKVREVLALLLLHHGHIVQSRTLIDELWGEEPPPSALATLQTYIYKLRKLLAVDPPSETLRTKAYGYVLTVASDDLDHCRFERLLAEGQAHFENGDLERVTTVLRQALSLWRGPVLADVDTGPILSAEATRLEERRLRALEVRIDADLQLGRHRELISELKSLTAVHPLHEVFHAKLMLALQGSGRRYEALEVYQQLRKMLVQELGLEPSASLVRLHQSMLSSDWTPEPPMARAAVLTTARPEARAATPQKAVPAPATGVPGPSVQGGGPSVPAARPPAGGEHAPDTAGRAEPPADGRSPGRRSPGGPPAPAQVPAQLPPDIEDFTGRGKVLEHLSKYLLAEDERTSLRVASIVGMAGAGKTALAVHLAHRVRHNFPDGQLFADLGSAGDETGGSADVLQQFLRAAGLAPEQIAATVDERAKQFRTWAAGRRVLIVLDGAVSSTQVTRLVPGSSGCAVIVTSRSHGLPSSATVVLDALPLEEGVAFLAKMVGPWRVEVERSAASRIVAMCGALPLAVRAAGMRLAASTAWPLEKFADELACPESRFNALRIGDLDVRAAYEAGYRRLGERERSIFQLLALLPADAFTATRAAGLLGCDMASAEALLGRLVESHLVRVVHRDPSGVLHYALPELGRIYARERLEQLIAGPPGARHGAHEGTRESPNDRMTVPLGSGPRPIERARSA